MINFFRIPFILLAIACLVLGLWTGLHRIGWDLHTLNVSMHHGAIMVGGFLGTLISLEKVIPLKKRFLFAIPVVSAASVALFLMNEPVAAFAALVLASAGLSGVFLWYLVRERNLTYLLMLAGGLCWLIGNALLMSKRFYPLAFPWWAAFTLCVITSERLELMKFLPVKQGTKYLLVFFLACFIGGILLSFHGPGKIPGGLALIAVALWLLRNDVITVAIRKPGLPRFVSTALFAGYGALLLTGVFFLTLDGPQPFSYDILIHTYFLGFVFSMIFAHGPIILPGVLGVPAKPYHPLLYIWLALLHISWITRITGDVTIDPLLRRISAIITACSILCYFATVATLTILSQHRHAKIL